MSFKEMASKREQEAETLEDSEIWMAIVSKFVLMEFDLDNRAEMLLQAVGGDKEIIKKAQYWITFLLSICVYEIAILVTPESFLNSSGRTRTCNILINSQALFL